MRIPGSFDVQRQHVRAGFCGRERRPIVDFHAAAGDGDAAFGKNHHRSAGFEQRDDRFHGQRAGGIDHQVIDERKQNLKMPLRRDLRMHQVGGREGQERADQQPVDKRLMIGDDQRLSGGFGVAAQFSAKKQTEQEANNNSSNGNQHLKSAGLLYPTGVLQGVARASA